jgi:predicted NBD/HSP70 family sugar kinase
MTMFAGLDVGGKTTAICVVDGAGKTVWQGMVDTHPDAIAARLKGFQEKLIKVGVESRCGAAALGKACLFPPLSSSGALVALP